MVCRILKSAFQSTPKLEAGRAAFEEGVRAVSSLAGRLG
jgi:hypothetical protein